MKMGKGGKGGKGRDRAASFRVEGLKKNACRKFFLLNYFLFNLFLFLQKSGRAKAPPPSSSLGAVPERVVIWSLAW